MREILFASSGPKLVFSAAGQIKLLRTGTDGYHEHNSANELLALPVCDVDSAGFTSRMDRYRVRKSELVQFAVLPGESGGEVEAVIGVNEAGGHAFVSAHPSPIAHPDTLRRLTTYHRGIAAALAYGNFAVRVRGEQYVAALTQLYESCIAGNVAVVPAMAYHADDGVVLVGLNEFTVDELALLEKDPRQFLRTSFKA